MIDKYVTIERLGFVRELLRISGFNSKIKANHVKTIDDAITMLKKQEEVVRCKNCQHGGNEQEGFIPCEHDIGTFNSIIHEPNWFCADGKKKVE